MTPRIVETYAWLRERGFMCRDCKHATPPVTVADETKADKCGLSSMQTQHDIIARVTNDKGRTFNVCLVRRGDRYGRNDALVHDKADPMIEWYDATFENDPGFDHRGRGQFVARYYLSTLIGDDYYSRCDHRKGSPGIDLCGHVPEWKVTGQNVMDALAAVESVIGGGK